MLLFFCRCHDGDVVRVVVVFVESRGVESAQELGEMAHGVIALLLLLLLLRMFLMRMLFIVDAARRARPHRA